MKIQIENIGITNIGTLFAVMGIQILYMSTQIINGSMDINYMGIIFKYK